MTQLGQGVNAGAELLEVANGDGKVGHMTGGDRDYDELAALYRIAAVAGANNEQQVVSEVLRVVADVVACERSLLFLYDHGADEMHVYSPKGDHGIVSLSEPTIIRRIFHSGRGEIVNSIASDPDANPAVAPWLDAKELVAAPLDVGVDRLGVVVALNSRRGAFAESDLRLLTLVADRAALTIENAQLRATMERQSQELTGLHWLSRLLASSETVDYAIGESVRIVSELLDCEKTVILLYEEEGDSLYAHPSTAGLTDEEVVGLRVPLSQPSLAATVFRTNTPLMSNDAPNDAWVGGDFRKLLGMKTVLVVPLTSGPKPLGVLEAINVKTGAFDEDDMRFLTLLGARIASVIESSRSRERERALLQKLREADRTKTEFVSMLAHELKGPMTTIKGFGEALHDSWETMAENRRNHFLEIVTKEIGRLSRLVNDLLDVSRMEDGALRYEMGPVSLDEVVNGIFEVHPSLRQAHEVEIELPKGLPNVLGDKDRIRQVLLNLLTNATRYAPEGTTISVRVAPDRDAAGDVVRVSVSDEGIGIAPEDQERVFSKFVMLPKPSWVNKGTGLGLFITRSIVDAHGGNIWVDSKQGEGTTFHFTLRVA